MKKALRLIALLGLALPTLAQEIHPAERLPEQAVNKWEQHQNRRLQLMERELKKIGITKNEKEQITALQKAHKQKMATNAQQTLHARNTLSALLDEGASMDALETSIQAVSAAQTEQLRILVSNRIEMERILGKEKYAKFMKNARVQYKKHGRRGGPGRPSVPKHVSSENPCPKQNRQKNSAPSTPAP